MTQGMLPDGSRYRYRFKWARPRVTVCVAETVRPVAFFWSRYPGIVVGLAVQVGPKVAGLTWGRPGKAVAVGPGRHRAPVGRRRR